MEKHEHVLIADRLKIEVLPNLSPMLSRKVRSFLTCIFTMSSCAASKTPRRRASFRSEAKSEKCTIDDTDGVLKISRPNDFGETKLSTRPRARPHSTQGASKPCTPLKVGHRTASYLWKTMGKPGGRGRGVQGKDHRKVTPSPCGPGLAASAPGTAAPATATAAQPSHPSEPSGFSSKTNANKKERTRKRNRQDASSSNIHPSQQSRANPMAPPKRTKDRPARFTHPQLEADLRLQRRPWLSPGDPLFQSALDRSYRGMKHVPRDSLPKAVHSKFRRCFDSLHEAGLFLYDTVQAGGKRLSRTFVTRTLLGDPGITYKVRVRGMRSK